MSVSRCRRDGPCRASRLAIVFTLPLLVGAAVTGCDCDDDGAVSDCIVDGGDTGNGDGSAEITLLNYLTLAGGGSRSRVRVDLEASTRGSALLRGVGYTGDDDGESASVDFNDEVADVSFTVRQTGGSGQAYVSGESVELEEGEAYSLLMTGDVADPNSLRLGTFRRDRPRPATDAVSLRFINALTAIEAQPDELDIRRRDRTVVSNIALGEASGFRDFTATDDALEFDLRDSAEDTVATVRCDALAGKRYEAILAYEGYARTGDDNIRLYCKPLD